MFRFVRCQVVCNSNLHRGRSRGRNRLQEAADVGGVLYVAMPAERYTGQKLRLTEREVCVSNPNEGVYGGVKSPST